MDIQKLLSSMRENASHYSNIEAEYVIEQETLLDEERTESLTYIRQGTKAHHVVFQGMSYYARIHENLNLTNGGHLDCVTEIGCDGKVTVTNQQGQFGIVNYSRCLPRSFFPPNKLGYPETSEYDLADFVEFTPLISADPNYDTLSIYSRALDSMQIDDLECVKVECADYGRPLRTQPRARTFIWICPDRNYLPIRCERYWHPFSETLPFVVYETGDWREVAPGVWVPCEGKSMMFEDTELKKGLSKPVNCSVIRVTSVRLDPGHDIEKFRRIDMPKGKPIHVIREGKNFQTGFIHDSPKDKP